LRIHSSIIFEKQATQIYFLVLNLFLIMILIGSLLKDVRYYRPCNDTLKVGIPMYHRFFYLRVGGLLAEVKIMLDFSNENVLVSYNFPTFLLSIKISPLLASSANT
jgi:hypothetical protein